MAKGLIRKSKEEFRKLSKFSAMERDKIIRVEKRVIKKEIINIE